MPGRSSLTAWIGRYWSRFLSGTDSDGQGNPQTYIWDGTVWVDIQETSDVISVNSQTGTVVLTTTNIAEGTNLYYTDGKVDARIALQTLNNHADVVITTPADNEVLAFDNASGDV